MTAPGQEVRDPGPALVERTLVRGTGEPEGRMITTAGDVLERTTTRTWWDGSDWHFEAQPLAWRRVTKLSAAELAEVQAAILASGILEAAAVREPERPSIGGSDVTWSVMDGDRHHAVELRGVPDASDPAVTALEGAVDAVIARALQRVAPDS